MLRKTLFALAACTTLAAAALAPTSASAHWHGGWHHGWYGGWHHGWYAWHRGYYHRPAVRVYAGRVYAGCMVRRWFYTPAGPVLRWVNRCY